MPNKPSEKSGGFILQKIGGMYMQWPQVVAIIMLTAGLISSICLHGETTKINWITKLISAIIWSVVLGYGGFWG